MSEYVANRPFGFSGRLFSRTGNRQCHVLIFALTVVLSATGACDTDNLNVIHRTSLWFVICVLVVTQAVVIHRRLASSIENERLRGMLAVMATVLLTTIEVHFLKYTPFLPKEPDPPLAFLIFIFPLAGPVALLALVLTPGKSTVARPSSTSTDSLAPPASVAPDGWPSARILRVSAQDHYLSVYTEQGEFFIRGRMKDALAILAAEAGLQIHRSHWIADTEIVQSLRVGRDYRVQLIDGAILPVSRARIGLVKRRLSQSSE